MHKPAVLHVEDQDEIAYIFEEAMLETVRPVSLFRVSDGEEALAFLHRDGHYEHAVRPELVVLDLNMPKVDGWAVAHSDASRPVFTLHSGGYPEHFIPQER